MPCSKAMKKQQTKMKKAAAKWRKKSDKYKSTHSYTAFIKRELR